MAINSDPTAGGEDGDLARLRRGPLVAFLPPRYHGQSSDSREAVAHCGLRREACACRDVADTIAKGGTPIGPRDSFRQMHRRASASLIDLDSSLL